jgi:hypothetical protein
VAERNGGGGSGGIGRADLEVGVDVARALVRCGVVCCFIGRNGLVWRQPACDDGYRSGVLVQPVFGELFANEAVDHHRVSRVAWLATTLTQKRPGCLFLNTALSDLCPNVQTTGHKNYLFTLSAQSPFFS